MKTNILCVDDDPNVLAGYQRNLRRDFAVDVALGGDEGLHLAQANGPYAVVVADMRMPGMNGVQFLRALRERSPDTIRIMLTGNAEQRTAMDAVNEGHVFQFLTKPCPAEKLREALDRGVEQFRFRAAERELLEKTLAGSVKVLLDILSMMDPQSFGRAERLREYAQMLLASFGNGPDWELDVAAMLSQIGCVTVPGDLAQRARSGQRLTVAELDLIARVPRIGHDLLANIPRLEPVARIILYQEKNFDGTGFPHDSVAGEDIPPGARVLRVLNDLVRLEETGTARAAALQQMQAMPGVYDPKVLHAAFRTFDVYLPDLHSAGSREVSLEELAAGDVLASDVLTRDGTLIVRAGVTISQMLVEKLRNFATLRSLCEPLHVRET